MVGDKKEKKRIKMRSSGSSVHSYIVIPEKYIDYKRSWLLIEKISYVFGVILENENGLKKYPVQGFKRRMSVLEVFIQYKHRIIKSEDLYSEKQRCFVISLYYFLLSIPEETIISYEYSDEYVPRFNVFNAIKAYRMHYLPRSIYARKDIWLSQKNEMVERLEDIVKSFNYDYKEMNEEGRAFYMELTKYAYNPERIERMAKKNNMEWYEYIDVLEL